MNKEIKLLDITKTIIDGGVTVNYRFEINGEVHVLSYSIKGEGINDCVADRCDSFVLSFLYYAMVLGYDFESTYPISSNLYYNLVYHYLPQMRECNREKVHDIRIKAPLTDISFHGEWNATGISCGIDSFSTLKEYTVDCDIDDYRLTHMLYFKVGAHHGLEFPTSPETEDRVFTEEFEIASSFCKKYGWPLVSVESNINHLCNTLFGYTDYEFVYSFRCVAAALLLQNKIKRYYFATGYKGMDDFDMDISVSVAHRSWWELMLFSTQSTHIIPANKAMSRIDKTDSISDFEPSYDSLMVCWKSSKNCGFCPKCVRTLVTLDILGSLEKFSKSFDLAIYYKYKKRLWHRIVALHKKDIHFGEIFDFMKANGISTPNKFVSYWSTKYQYNRKKMPRWLDNLLNRIIPI